MSELANKTDVYMKPFFRIRFSHDVYAKMANRIHVLSFLPKQMGVGVALQVVADLPFEDVDCFAPGPACAVPMRSFLSQLP